MDAAKITHHAIRLVSQIPKLVEFFFGIRCVTSYGQKSHKAEHFFHECNPANTIITIQVKVIRLVLTY